MRRIFARLVGPVLGLSLFLLPGSALAAINLPWSTTYNCPESDQFGWFGSIPLVCDGISRAGGWTTNGLGEQITSPANYPGGGGRGQRHWKGDGSNSNSGGTSVSFVTVQPELWIRWHMRYETGFKWNPLTYDKILYIHTATQSVDVIVEFSGSDGFDLYAQGGSGHLSCANCGWNTIMGGSTSNGQWSCYEVHIKMDTNGSNGIGEYWLNGVKKYSNSSANFGTKPGWGSILIGSNQYAPNNGRSMYVDFDDIAISNTGRIGCSGTTPPAAPQNLQLTP